MFTPNTCVARVAPSALSHGIAGQTVNLNVVPEDIHHLILTELADTSPLDVLNVAQSSVTLRNAALPFIHHNITLTRGPKKSKKQMAYQALVENFRGDEHGELAKHVRSITVTNDVPSEDLIMVLNKIAQHGTLRSLNWETSAHMSRAVFDMIHATWPQLELRVVTVDRHDENNVAHRQMDMRLLSSPLLVKLTYVVYIQGYSPDMPCRSDWPRLSQALAAGGNVQYLRLQSRQDVDGYYETKLVPDTEPEKLPRLDLASGLRLPQLEELSIQVLRYWGRSTYLWYDDHCRMFREFIDCSRLRKLDFGVDNPTAFFTCFAELCPKLKTLSFGVTEGTATAIEPAKMFIESLDALEHLDVSQAQQFIDDLWPAIKKHSHTLKTLILGPTMFNRVPDSYVPEYMELDRLEAIASTIPKLERLGWPTPCRINIDAKHLEVLSSMKLKKLDLYLHIPGEASDYCDELTPGSMGVAKSPPLDKKRSIAAAIGIAEALSESQQDALQWLTLHISRMTYGDRADPWMMHTKLQLRRNTYSSQLRGKKWDIRGKMDWYSLPPLDEDLLFENE